MGGIKDMEKEYSYDELADILGCSRTAVSKKVTPDPNNPSVERYRKRYNVVLKDGKKCIVLDDEALELEKKLSKGSKNVSKKGVETSEIQDTEEVKPVSQVSKEETDITVTERYMDKFLIMQQHMYNQLHDRDKEILLLTVNEKQKEEAYLQTEAKNSELTDKYNIMEKKYNVAKNIIIGFVTLTLMYATFCITMKYNSQKVSNDLVNVSNVQEQVINDKKPAEAQEVVTPPAPQQVKKVVRKRK